MSRTHTPLPRPIHGPRKVIRDRGDHDGHANVRGGLFNTASIVRLTSMILMIHDVIISETLNLTSMILDLKILRFRIWNEFYLTFWYLGII